MDKPEKYVIKNGRVIDPANGIDSVTEVYIAGETIERVGGKKNFQGRTVIDAGGMLIVPGLVDLHVHLREPGGEDAETIGTGALAAVRGGYTAICCMPNTDPPLDGADSIRYIYDRAREAACWVYPIACVTKGQNGEELTEMADLAMAGAVAFSDDGKPIANPRLLLNALTYAKMLEMVIVDHCEDTQLCADGSMHEGIISGKLGMPAMPGISEAATVARDIMIAGFVDAPLHICHVSAKESVEAIRLAKDKNWQVTAEVTPHHLTLTDESVVESGFDANFKMNPPLRSAEDVEILRQAIAEGTIDAIATDHAPHPPQEKDKDFPAAPFGVIGLETALGVVFTELVKKGIIDEKKMVEVMSTNPAKILDLPAGTLSPGAFADITIIDPDRKWEVDPDEFASLSRNTPFAGRELVGKAILTMVAGEIVHDELRRKK